jgi:RNA recognition motif-containing protein
MTRRPYTAFVRNVAHAATEAELRAVLEREIGGVTYVRLIVDRERAGEHRGFGFVSFLNQGYFRAALADDGQITLHGRPIFLAPTRS